MAKILSLNETSTFKDQQRHIQESNVAMLKRLQESKPTYNVEKWEKDRLSTLKRAGMRSKYDLQIISKKDLLGISKEEKAEILNTIG